MFRVLLRTECEDRTFALFASRPMDLPQATADAARHNDAGKLGVVASVMSDADYQTMTFDRTTGRITTADEDDQ